MKVYSFGINNVNSDVNISSVTANPFVVVTYEFTTILSHLIGLYNANNLNAAIAIGTYFKVPDEMIKAALEAYVPDNNRSQMLKKGSNQIILDAYNANPSSMAVAIDNFLQLDSASKVMVLGDMFELGQESLEEHKAIVSKLSNAKDCTCYLIGSDFYSSKTEANHLKFFKSFDNFSEYLKGLTIKNSTILIKGSRGMALERTLIFIAKNYCSS
jgi:UDP-N-acetylmuramoyl-tripeptide--D-alanyl-D-alanine ligase